MTFTMTLLGADGSEWDLSGGGSGVFLLPGFDGLHLPHFDAFADEAGGLPGSTYRGMRTIAAAGTALIGGLSAPPRAAGHAVTTCSPAPVEERMSDPPTRHFEWMISSRNHVGDVSEPLPYDPSSHLPPQFDVLRRTVTPAGAGPWLPRDQWPTVASALEKIRAQAAGALARIRFSELLR